MKTILVLLELEFVCLIAPHMSWNKFILGLTQVSIDLEMGWVVLSELFTAHYVILGIR